MIGAGPTIRFPLRRADEVPSRPLTPPALFLERRTAMSDLYDNVCFWFVQWFIDWREGAIGFINLASEG
jgi:hypothetical protein